MSATTQSEAGKPGTDDLLPTRQSLLGRLKSWGDHQSWQEFFDTYWRLIYNVARKAGLSDAEAEEVVQETVLSVAKAMKDFQYDKSCGSFKGWLLQLTGWRIKNQVRKRPGYGSENAENGAGPLAGKDDREVPAELEQIWDKEWEQNLLQAACQRVRARVNPRHFQIFDLSVNQGRSTREVQQFLGGTLAEIYVSRHRVTRLVKEEVRKLRHQWL